MDIRQFLASTSAHPKQILKVVLSLSVILLVVWLFMVSRMELTGPGRHADPAAIERADSLRTAIQPARPNREFTSVENEPNIFMNAVTTFFVLISIVVVVWFLIRKSTVERSDKGGNFRDLEEHPVGSGSHLKVMEVNGEIWVLGVTSANVHLLHRYQRNEWKEREGSMPQKVEGNFLEYFKKKL